MRFFFIVFFILFTGIVNAQSFNGDWKGTATSEWTDQEFEFNIILHIKGDDCSRELISRSSSQIKEMYVIMDKEEDNSVSIYLDMPWDSNGEKADSREYFKGKIENGKLVGVYTSKLRGKQNVTLKKVGPGKFSIEKLHHIETKTGYSIYTN